jgi:tRNA(Ile)-lysidine synthase
MPQTKQRVSSFAKQLLSEWKRLQLSIDGRVVVAVSGGADSTALLLALDELIRLKQLNIDPIVAHLNHGLRGEKSREDADWVASLVGQLGYELVIGQGDVRQRVADTKDNLEQAARRVRYEFLIDVANNSRSTLILTAHTKDDQAETLLLRLIRGSGTDGLSGIAPVRYLNRDLRLIRPLLWAERSETEDYCRIRDIEFRLDEMNEDATFSRVRVRKTLIPLLKSFNPRAVKSLARAADLLREDMAALAVQAEELLSRASVTNSSLSVDLLRSAPTVIRRRALRRWIERERGNLRRIELIHLLSIEKLLAGDKGGRIAELPGGSFVERRKGLLTFYGEKG